jgi:hypothetical protein
MDFVFIQLNWKMDQVRSEMEKIIQQISHLNGLIHFDLHPEHHLSFQPDWQNLFDQILQIVISYRDSASLFTCEQLANWWKIRNSCEIVKENDLWIIKIPDDLESNSQYSGRIEIRYYSQVP